MRLILLILSHLVTDHCLEDVRIPSLPLVLFPVPHDISIVLNDVLHGSLEGMSSNVRFSTTTGLQGCLFGDLFLSLLLPHDLDGEISSGSVPGEGVFSFVVLLTLQTSPKSYREECKVDFLISDIVFIYYLG